MIYTVKLPERLSEVSSFNPCLRMMTQEWYDFEATMKGWCDTERVPADGTTHGSKIVMLASFDNLDDLMLYQLTFAEGKK